MSKVVRYVCALKKMGGKIYVNSCRKTQSETGH